MSSQDIYKNTSTEDEVDIEDDFQYEETVLATDWGTVTFRDCGNGEVWLGISRGNSPHSPPEISIKLTQRQQTTLSSLFIECRRSKCTKQ